MTMETVEDALAAVHMAGWELQFMPAAVGTGDICLEAVRQDWRALECVPGALKTPEMLALAEKSKRQ